MKILWVKSDFLHPTTRGGQIRTLEMLRWLHRRHEVHYLAFGESSGEGWDRCSEYATRAYPISFSAVDKDSVRFYGEILSGCFSRVPLAVGRFRSKEMTREIERVREREKFDALVCDFLVPVVNIPRLEDFVLFQHNVETAIWRRRAEQAPDPVRRAYFQLQAKRMERYEAEACRRARHVVAVSEADAVQMRQMFGLQQVSSVPTGVNLEYFAPPPAAEPVADLVFVGSMDWMPNHHGMSRFLRETLPLIRRTRPDCSVVIVGRQPSTELRQLAEASGNVRVTGTVPDVRPYLWGSRLSIVPLDIGGGTRLKIYESMAAGVPVVSTTVGAEGLEIEPEENILIADRPDTFAAQCLRALDDAELHRRLSHAGSALVHARFSWERIAQEFGAILEQQSEGRAQ